MRQFSSDETNWDWPHALEVSWFVTCLAAARAASTGRPVSKAGLDEVILEDICLNPEDET